MLNFLDIYFSCLTQNKKYDKTMTLLPEIPKSNLT